MAVTNEKFKAHLEAGYKFKKDFIILGVGMIDGEAVEGAHAKIALKTMNRHGLIAGATGTGKTKTLQILAEQLSCKGIPSLLMDLKGDLSGIAKPGQTNDHIVWRHGEIGIPYKAEAMPTELMTISEQNGVRLRATVSEFGPVLFSKMLNLNETQQGIMATLFKYCDDHKLPLLDLKDMKKMLQYAKGAGKKEIQNEYGSMSSVSIGTIVRKIIELESQGAELFFGEKSFDVKDLCRKEGDKGVVSVIRLNDIQDKPKLFSTFMLSLLAEVYSTFPEQGDADEPKLCIFIDEAHLIFKEASDALMDQIEAIIKLIRSKGVGIFFCTQNPTDIPDAVLSQLGMKIQHALRAFTAKDRKAIKKAAENYPDSEYYKTDKIITELGIGEALFTGLNEKGIPTPLSAVLLQAPKTRMDILTAKEIKAQIANSDLARFYNEDIDRESAFEMLNERIEKAQSAEHKKEIAEQKKKAEKSSTRKSSKKEKSFMESASKNTMVRQIGRTVFRELARGLLGILGVKR